MRHTAHPSLPAGAWRRRHLIDLSPYKANLAHVHTPSPAVAWPVLHHDPEPVSSAPSLLARHRKAPQGKLRSGLLALDAGSFASSHQLDHVGRCSWLGEQFPSGLDVELDMSKQTGSFVPRGSCRWRTRCAVQTAKRSHHPRPNIIIMVRQTDTHVCTLLPATRPT